MILRLYHSSTVIEELFLKGKVVIESGGTVTFTTKICARVLSPVFCGTEVSEMCRVDLPHPLPQLANQPVTKFEYQTFYNVVQINCRATWRPVSSLTLGILNTATV